MDEEREDGETPEEPEVAPLAPGESRLGPRPDMSPPARVGRRMKVLLANPLAQKVLAGLVGLAVVAFALRALFGGIGDPSDVALAEPAPDSFLVELETSAGDIRISFHRDWSPIGVDRVYHLARMNFYEGARIYRVNNRYAQFGYTGRPAIDSAWVSAGIPDELVVESNVRGTVSFARGGPNSRSVILFVNRGDNSNLDQMAWRGVLGFPPLGRVTTGMEVVDQLFSGYGEDPLQWEDSIARQGNTFLDQRYPELDSIFRVRVVDRWR